MIARRSFLRRATLMMSLPAAAATGAVAASVGPRSQPGPVRVGRPRLDTLTRDDFAGRLGRTVRVRRRSGPALPMRLVEAQDLTRPGDDRPGSRAPFALTLEGGRSERLAQETYRVEFGGLGTFDVFLVPVGSSRRVVRYEAVFG